MNERIADDVVNGEYWVSTVGIPGNIWGRYETMVFECDSDGNVTNWIEVDYKRYRTSEEAAAGHITMLNKWAGKE